MEEELMQLEPGKTILGKTYLQDEASKEIMEFTVYYGNALSPLVNNKVMHMPDETYKKMLEAFLNEDDSDSNEFIIEKGGFGYEIPTQREVRNASIEMINREQRAQKQLEKEHQEKLEAQKALEKKQEEEAAAQLAEQQQEQNVPLQNNAAPEPQQTNNVPNQKKGFLNNRKPKEEKKTDEQNKVAEQNINLSDTDVNKLDLILAEIRNGTAKRIRRYRIFTVLIAVIALAAMALAGYIYYKDEIVGQSPKTLITVNGQPYNVPVADVVVSEGEKKILVYGFTVTNNNGQIEHTAIPLGEFNLAE